MKSETDVTTEIKANLVGGDFAITSNIFRLKPFQVRCIWFKFF